MCKIESVDLNSAILGVFVMAVVSYPGSEDHWISSRQIVQIGWYVSYYDSSKLPVKPAVSALCVLLTQVSHGQPLKREGEDGKGDGESTKDTKLNMVAWRHGPAQLWYDMLGISEEDEHFDYGFKVGV